MLNSACSSLLRPCVSPKLRRVVRARLSGGSIGVQVGAGSAVPIFSLSACRASAAARGLMSLEAGLSPVCQVSAADNALRARAFASACQK